MTKPDTVLTIKKYMKKGNTLFSVQYADYTIDEWTVPVMLTEDRVEQLLNDNSIKTIRLFYNNEPITLLP